VIVIQIILNFYVINEINSIGGSSFGANLRKIVVKDNRT
jgi:hypothetical protein